jgi:hypothetical protein
VNAVLLRKALWIAVVVLLGASAGVASAAEDAAEGKRRFERGEALFVEGRFMEAAREFEAGYAAAPRPLFLLNIGHSYRRAGELAKARNAYKLLLRLQPGLPQRVEVEGYIKSIDDALGPELPEGTVRPAEPARTLPPTGTSSSEPPRSVLPTPASAAAASEPTTTTTSIVDSSATRDEPEDSPSIFRKTWFWVVVGTVVAGAATATIFALRPTSSSCPANVYCIKEMP